MNRLGRWMLRLLQTMTCGLMVILLGTLSWQVLSRYLLHDPSTVTEELARLCLMWLGTLGTTLCFLLRKHLAFDLLSEKSSPRNRRYMLIFSDACVVLFGALLLIGGATMIWQKWSLGQISPVLKIPYVYVDLVLPLAGLCIAFSPFFDLPREQAED